MKFVLKVKERLPKLQMKNRNEAILIKNDAFSALSPRKIKLGQLKNLFKPYGEENDKYGGFTKDKFERK